MKRATLGQGAVTIVLLALFGVVVAAPVVMVYAQSFAGGSALLNALVSERHWSLLFHTIGLAGTVAAFGTLLGAVLAFQLQSISPRLRAVIAYALAMPLLVPQHIMAIAWVDVLGRNGYLAQFVQIAMPGVPPTPTPFNFWGAVFILTVTAYPIPMIATLAGLWRLDVRLEEAARVTGIRRGIFWAITFPLVAPATIAGALLVFALTASSFAVPSLLQVMTYPVEIHASSSMFDYANATALSLPLVSLMAVTFLAWSLFVRPRHAWLNGAVRRTQYRVGAPLAQSARITVLLFTGICTCGVPLLSLFLRSLPLRTYGNVWSTAHDEIANGLIVAFFSALVVTPMAFALGYLVRDRRLRRVVQVFALVAFVLPGPLIALGMISLWNRDGIPGAIYDSLLILVLACAARFYALADALFPVAFARLTVRIEEAASIAGVAWWRNATQIVLPLTLPLVVLVWVLTFLLSLGEVDAAVLLCPPGESTFAVRLFSLMHYGPDSFVAALSLLTACGVMMVGAVGLIAAHVLANRLRIHA